MATNEPQAPPGWILIEQDGALNRGPGRGSPLEIWSRASDWKSYPRGTEKRRMGQGDIDCRSAPVGLL